MCTRLTFYTFQEMLFSYHIANKYDRHNICFQLRPYFADRNVAHVSVRQENVIKTMMLMPFFSHFRRLHSNNLHCDCHLSWLSDWLRARRGLAPFTQCMAPAHMRGLNVPDVQKKDFVCNGELTLTHLHIKEGRTKAPL